MTSFRTQMLYWDEECLDTTLCAIEIYNLLKEPIKNIEQIINFSKRHFDYEEGGFFNNLRQYPTIYGTSIGSEIDKRIKSITGSSIIDSEKEEKVKEFINRCEKEINDSIGFANTPYNSPEIFSTYNTIKILTERKWLDDGKKTKIKKFITKHKDTINTKNSQITRFKNVWDDEPLLHVTYWALDSLDRLSEKYSKKFDVAKFLELCWFEEDNYGGFKPNTSFDQPTIFHTKYALQLLDKMKIKILTDDMENKIINYLGECEDDGGFGFDVGLLPNICATRDAISILNYLDREDIIKKYKKRIIKFVNSHREEGFVGYIQ